MTIEALFDLGLRNLKKIVESAEKLP